MTALDSGPVRNIVKRLRRKLGDDPADPSYILTEPRFGYRMAQAETPEEPDAQLANRGKSQLC